jgi:S1-C subfamily serine protease
LVLAKNEKDDLALLIAKAIPKKMEPVTLGDSGKIRLGERIIEVGNPFGVGSSVTSGIISAVERKVPDMGNAAMIQHDAATNPGNSGGPTAGMDGNVIGMTDEIIAPHLFGPGQNSGVTYAIPSNRFRQWAEVILKARL